MPIIHTIDKDLSLIRSMHLGRVDDATLLTSYESLFCDPDFDPAYGLLVDLRQADSTVRDPSALSTMVTLVAGRYRGDEVAGRLAILAPGDVSFGLGRMFQTFGRSLPVSLGVFRDFEMALGWLGVPDA